VPADDPYISVVIPTYNRAEFIDAALDSVYAQEDAPWPIEIVVVDDGSDDDTRDVLQRHLHRIRYHRIDHSGLPAVARNVGVAAARGELVAFLDSDDLWMPDKLAVQVPAFDDPRVVLSHGAARTISAPDLSPGEFVVDPAKLHRARDFLSLLEANVISTLTAVARRSALLDVGGFNEAPGLMGVEDYELWLRLASTFPHGITAIPRSIGLYRVHDSGLGTADSAGALARLLEVYDAVWQWNRLNDAQRSALGAAIVRMHENWSRQRVLDGDVPAVSVVMSVYRDAPFAAQAVHSILNQTFEDLELVVVDDGSDDGSYDAVAAFDDSRIRIVRQTNHGLVAALNTGIRVARAPLIARQDADDVSLPDRLAREVEHMLENPRCAVVGTFFRYVDERTLAPTGVTITSVTKHLDIVRCMYFDNPIGHGTALVQRAAIQEVGGYSDAYGPNEDYDLWRRLAAAGWELAILPEVHYLYRVNSSGISHTQQELQHRLFARLVETIWRGPVQFKSFVRIVADNYDYKRLDSSFRETVHRQYQSHQLRLAGEFLARRHFRSGAHTLLGALLIAPGPAARVARGQITSYARGAARRARRMSRRR
jgi:glycosyltransferase involved in cell wall biosynthesis